MCHLLELPPPPPAAELLRLGLLEMSPCMIHHDQIWAAIIDLAGSLPPTDETYLFAQAGADASQHCLRLLILLGVMRDNLPTGPGR